MGCEKEQIIKCEARLKELEINDKFYKEFFEKMDKKFDVAFSLVDKKIDNAFSEIRKIVDDSTTKLTDMSTVNSKRIGRIEKWQYTLMGLSSALGFFFYKVWNHIT